MTMFRLFGVALLLGPASLLSAQQTLHVDPAASEVRFTLKSSHEVHGTFKVELGTVKFDSNGQMSGNVVVDAASGQSGNAGRDKKMTEDQLQASNFSTVIFAPRHFGGKVAPAGDSSIQVDGVFTLLGQPHDITVPMRVHIEAGHCKATGSFVVPFVKWGVKDPSIFILKVAKDVTIDLKLIGEVSPD